MKTSTKLWAYTSMLDCLAFITPQQLLVWLAAVSTAITIAHNAYKFYKDLRGESPKDKSASV